MAPVLSVRNLSAGYGKKQVLFDVSLNVMPAEIVLVTGGNGSGKSTLLKAIYGLLPPWNGEAEIVFCPNSDGPALSTRPARLNLRNGLAYLPQKHAVFDDLTVEENLRIAGQTLRDHRRFVSRRAQVLASLPRLQLMLRRKPETMSGGENQLVALALVLLHLPKLLLLDEPLAGLDDTGARDFVNMLCQLRNTEQTAIMVVEHRRVRLATAIDRSIVVTLGRVAPLT